MAKDPDIILLSLDECHFQQHGSRCTMWVPPEDKDPVVLLAPTRKSVALFGAVNLSSGEFNHMHFPVFNAETFQRFLKSVLESYKGVKKIVIILDNARYHHAVMLNKWLKKNKKKITLLFLPPYSPNLNPIERVWKLTKRLCTHNKYFPQLKQLTDCVNSQLTAWNRPNKELRKLCCII